MAQYTTSFTLDENKAKSAGGSQYITSSGSYIGTFTMAYVTLSNTQGSNAEFMNFDFTDEIGRQARFKVTIKDSEGKEAFGVNFVHAILALLNVPSMKAMRRTVTFGNNSFEVPAFPAICGKPIGVVLQRENYTWDGKEKYTFNLLQVFDAESGRTISEIRGNSPAVAITQLCANLHDKTRENRNSAPQPNQPSSSAPKDDFGGSEDVPF